MNVDQTFIDFALAGTTPTVAANGMRPRRARVPRGFGGRSGGRGRPRRLLNAGSGAGGARPFDERRSWRQAVCFV